MEWAMRWTDRQRAMLDAMGVRLHEPPDVRLQIDDAGSADASASALVPAAAAAEAPARAPSRLPVSMAEARPAPVPDRRPAAPAPRAVPDVPAAPSTLAGLGWDALREAVAGCRACGLCESRTRTVFGTGHEQARLMIVGEAPGEHEDQQGEPFVGQAGKLLDNMLRPLGLSRHDDVPPAQRVFITNTLKCRPPRNRNPDPAETARCAPFLARQVELVQPRLLLAMGRFAAQALLATEEPVGRLRGKVHRWRDTPVVVTYHPAYLLRTLADKARAWDDLCLAAAVLENTE
jgi:uracil-DNA glycosylase